MTWTLERDHAQRLMLTHQPGQTAMPVTAVRPFPISAPDDGVALVDRDGHEVLWIERLDQVAEPARSLIESEIKQREFMPVIESLKAVSTFITPSTWSVDTDRGPTDFVLGGEEFIRRLSQGSLLIADIHGLHYLVRDIKKLDRTSRKLLDRFL